MRSLFLTCQKLCHKVFGIQLCSGFDNLTLVLFLCSSFFRPKPKLGDTFQILHNSKNNFFLFLGNYLDSQIRNKEKLSW